MKLCECGCGNRTTIITLTNNKRGRVKGQYSRFVAGHNWRREPAPGTHVYKQVYIPHGKRTIGLAHVVLAERALGKPLPQGVEVHHADGNTLNNTPSNLVICQDRAYHKLLHVRARILRAGGNPNIGQFCHACKRFLLFEAFCRSTANIGTGRGHYCRECASAYNKAYWRNVLKKAVA